MKVKRIYFKLKIYIPIQICTEHAQPLSKRRILFLDSVRSMKTPNLQDMSDLSNLF